MIFVSYHESEGKTNLFHRVLGQVLLALTRENSGLPPLGFAVDCGTANDLIISTGCGRITTPDLRGPFWDQCSVARIEGVPYFPFGQLCYCNIPVMLSIDTLHLLKRFSSHHQSATRTIWWGSCYVDFSTLLGGGPTSCMPDCVLSRACFATV